MSNKYLDSINTSMRLVPRDYKQARKQYEYDLAAKIEEEFEMSPNVYKIGVEYKFGTLDFSDYVCRLTSAIDPKTGMNLGDDFRRVISRDLNDPMEMGWRYKFSDNIWIVTNTNNDKDITKSCIIRRCNNVAKWVDKSGCVIEEPCIVGYALKYSNAYFNDLNALPQGTIILTMQNNQNSKKLLLNDRLYVGSMIYKARAINDFLREKTYDETSNPLIEVVCSVDIDSSADINDSKLASADTENRNATNMDNDNRQMVVFVPEIDSLIAGISKNIEVYLYNGEHKTNLKFTFTASGIPEENYIFDVINDNSFSITNVSAYLKKPLEIKCVCENGVERTMFVTLRGLY